ncbi:MAG: cadmium-translocating P-type ATPase [Alphaproteobacteria bacterium]|nr:cadmium-translocating P-type ATPase [Alphaproteobacteria bacterium]
MTTTARFVEESPGCPSGLEPASEAAPVADPAPFVRRKDGRSTLELAVFGAKCAGCIAKIEGGVSALPGVESARLNLSTGKLSVSWRANAAEPKAVVDKVVSLGYRAAPFDPDAAAREKDVEGRKLLRCLAVAGFAAANVMLLSIAVWAGENGEMETTTRTLFHWLSAVIALPAAAYAGRPFFESAVSALRKGRANMDVPISLAVLLALGLSLYETAKGGVDAYFDASMMLLFFLLIGRFLDHRLRAKARDAAQDLLALQSPTATRLDADNMARAVAAREIRPGDILLLSPGDRAPVDGEIIEGRSNVDVSLVTGESAPVAMQTGAKLHAGALNLSSRLVMRASATTDDSLLADLARLIEAGEQTKSRYVRLADKAASLYVPIVHSVALATFGVWYFLVDAGLRVSMTNAIAVLIITCPCALGLAAPAVQVVATSRLFRKGVLVKSGDALERLAKADAIIFDKTGTLTRGRQRLANAGEIPAATLEAAAKLARSSRHPLSRAIVAAAGPGVVAEHAVEHHGFGVEGVVDGRKARLGAAVWCGAPAAEGSAQTETWFAFEGGAPTRFVFEDELRADAGAVVRALEARGLSVTILSGDLQAPAARIAAQLGVAHWRARVTPKEKTAVIEALAERGAKTAMVGDGLNDAPSLAAAYVSLSPGSAADASQAAADFVYQGDTLAPVVDAVDIARKARRRMIENFAFAAFYNLCAVPLAAFGFVTPLIAALAMSGSSIAVTLNALRLAAPAGAKP